MQRDPPELSERLEGRRNLTLTLRALGPVPLCLLDAFQLGFDRGPGRLAGGELATSLGRAARTPRRLLLGAVARLHDDPSVQPLGDRQERRQP